MLGPVLCISKRRILLPKQKEHEAKEQFGFPFYFMITSVIWTTAGLENATFASPLINNNRNHVNKWSNFNCNLNDTDLPFTSHLSAFFAIPCNNFKHSLFYLRPPPTQTTIPEFATQSFFLVLEGNGQILHDHSPLSAFLLHTLPMLSPQLLLALQISEGELLKGESPCVLWISFFPVMILGLHLLYSLSLGFHPVLCTDYFPRRSTTL